MNARDPHLPLQADEATALGAFAERVWDDEIVDQLRTYITIPNISPAYEDRWEELGHMERAVALVRDWCAGRRRRGSTPKRTSSARSASLEGRPRFFCPDSRLDQPGRSLRRTPRGRADRARAGRPEPRHVLGPVRQRPQGRRTGAVVGLPALVPVGDQTGRLQRRQVLGHRRLRHPRRRRQRPHGLLALAAQPLEQGPTGRVGQGAEQEVGLGFHGRNR